MQEVPETPWLRSADLALIYTLASYEFAWAAAGSFARGCEDYQA